MEKVKRKEGSKFKRRRVRKKRGVIHGKNAGKKEKEEKFQSMRRNKVKDEGGE